MKVPSIDEKLTVWETERRISSKIRSCVYISTPITTGPKFVEWNKEKGQQLLDKNDYETSLKADVILPNVQRANLLIELLRWQHTGLLINPTGLEVSGWVQSDYHTFWSEVIRRHAQRVIFLDGWEYSSGCTIEFETAQENDIDCVDENLKPISLLKGLALIQKAIKQIKSTGGNTELLEKTYIKLKGHTRISVSNERKLYKDEVLNHIACTSNVAQFVSFEPGSSLQQRYCRIVGFLPNQKFATPEIAIQALLDNAPAKKLNIRSYRPEKPEGNPFIKNLETVEDVITEIQRLAGSLNLYTIVNEVIDESDGGISGVSHRGLMEFAPDTTPRCVDDENIETAVFPFELGMQVLETIYGFEPDLRGREGARIEFSIHPTKVGWDRRHTIIWQSEQRPNKKLTTYVQWPNKFSQMLGDKAYGLVVASSAGFPVPRTMVFNRRLFPFVFGQSTGMDQMVTRTCPATKEPGYYLSARGWYDPYAVLEGRILAPNDRKWNPPPSPLSSVLIQNVIPAIYSGRALNIGLDDFDIKGVSGIGDAFMLGDKKHETIPQTVKHLIIKIIKDLNNLVGPCNIEWVFDGKTVWIVQLNNVKIKNERLSLNIDIEWVEFFYSKNRLEEFRQTVIGLQGANKGVNVIGNVSPLSHLGEIAEIYEVPVKFTSPDD